MTRGGGASGGLKNFSIVYASNIYFWGPVATPDASAAEYVSLDLMPWLQQIKPNSLLMHFWHDAVDVLEELGIWPKYTPAFAETL